MQKIKLNIIRVLKDLFIYMCVAVFVTCILYAIGNNIPRTTAVFVVITLAGYFIITLLMVLNTLLTDKNRWIITSKKEVLPTDSLGKAIYKKHNASAIEEHVAIHEAGHAVMAYLLDFNIYEIIVSNEEMARTITECRMNTKEDIEKLILLKYAGAVAEELIMGYFGYGNMGFPNSDFESAKQYIKGYIVMTEKEVSKSMLDTELSEKIIAYSKKFYMQTYQMLSNNTDKIRRLSERICSNASWDLTTEEIKKVIEDTEE